MKLFYLIVMFNLFITDVAFANDQSELKFKEGSVLVICSMQDELLSTKVFNKAFPHLILSLDKYIKEKTLIRAHYLGQLKEGVFMVVGGDTKEKALENAVKITAESSMILNKAFIDSDIPVSERPKRSCQFIEIGPVALKQ